MFGSIGSGEILIVLVLILLLFGSKKLPELARSLGKGIRQFRKAAEDIKDEIRIDDTDDDLLG